MRRLGSVLGPLATLLLSGAVHAASYTGIPLSILGLSQAGAVVANTQSLGALAYNPANMAFHKSGYGIGILGLYVHTSVQPPGQTGRIPAVTPHWGTTPNAFINAELTKNTRFGLALNEPYDSSIAWPASAFPALSGPSAGLVPTYTELQVYDASPNLTYRVGPVGVDAGADYYYVRHFAADTAATVANGSGNRFGGNVGVASRIGPIGLGATFRSAVNIPVGGATSIHLPWQMALGIHGTITKRFGMEFDFARSGWTGFTSPATAAGPAVLASAGNVNSYRLGFEYGLGEGVALRAGLGYNDVSPAPFSARLPAASQDVASLGATQRTGPWTLSAGYEYIHFNTRTVDTETTLTGADPNGTSAYNGSYRGSVQLFGLSFSRRFS
ncbi:MAG: outer membrane protein transport protein [Gammaproteobacteria bacterium]|nr:outer membrane protein transport protein [Gammaproteobacteria bacterium]